MISIVGLGPSGLDRLPVANLDRLNDPSRPVIVRTLEHPAAAELARQRSVEMCDDLYEAADDFDSLYIAIAERVLARDDVVYAVPGSPLVGEASVRLMLRSGRELELLRAESFIDAVLEQVGYDPLERGLQVLDAYELPDPLVLDKPTIIAQVDTPQRLADTCAALARALPEGSEVMVLRALGGEGSSVSVSDLEDVDPQMAGYRTSMWVDAAPGGLIGAVKTVRMLRRECPWDREQTHQSLVPHLVEEAYELIDAISALDGDWVAYGGVEEEVGDVLLQVLFHAAVAREAGAFDIDDAAEVLRQKLVRRHPHVFADVVAESASQVEANWDEIKRAEKAGPGNSVLGDLPASLPAMQRALTLQRAAARVGFDWDAAGGVAAKVREEIDELERSLAGDGNHPDEVGDLLFTLVNLARHLGVDPEVALGRAAGRFQSRFQRMEAGGALEGLSPEELDRRWEEAKGAESPLPGAQGAAEAGVRLAEPSDPGSQ